MRYDKRIIFLFQKLFIYNGVYLNYEKTLYTLISKYDLYSMLFNYGKYVNNISLNTPFNICFKTNLRSFIIFKLRSYLCFVLLHKSLLNQKIFNYIIIYFRYKKSSLPITYISFLYTLQYLRKYLKSCDSSLINKSIEAPIYDDLNMSLCHRLYIAQNFKLDQIYPVIHGGGSFVYKNPHDYYWQTNSVFFRKGLFFALKKLRSVAIINNCSDQLTVGIAPYWCSNASLVFQGQEHFSLIKHQHFINDMCRHYVNSKIVLRDPSSVVTKLDLINHKSLFFDIGSKDQRKFVGGASWSDNFISSTIVYVTGFFTLGLQLLFANIPCIISVTKSNLYSHISFSSKSLFDCGVFVHELDESRKFSSYLEISLWWSDSKKYRDAFLKDYLDGITGNFNIKQLNYIN